MQWNFLLINLDSFIFNKHSRTIFMHCKLFFNLTRNQNSNPISLSINRVLFQHPPNILQRSNHLFAKSIRKLQPSTQVGNPWQTSSWAINRWPRWKGPVSRCDIVPQRNQNTAGNKDYSLMDEGVIFIRERGGRRRGCRCRQCPQACLPVSAEGDRCSSIRYRLHSPEPCPRL